ncbi:hypothetical protein [Mycetocola zhadangensis]|uniref:YtxH domain-containing protein n=1 Tax=Mycetocola zhadangensis TaxID=1164595 RepID=A0A3L7J186_9MICO|nr:hypothetical protein [Mycetocola zhadangensis]RLQ84296.1 hypothetical protein D9V28_08820 [Mycetocola zhadangensis]GGE94304.1 hypothetical protein GCM10011313_16590 [Mycetocola zhadangensis]
MSPRFIFILALAFAAYVLGAKAGRPRYEQIRTSVTSFWDDPKVRATRKKVGRKAARSERALAKKIKQRKR